MSGCRSHADDVGPYVLGALEPEEMDAMRAHLTECARCAAEARSLAEIPGLLDLTHADDTIAAISPGLEEEVLDRYVRERARSVPSRRRRWPRLAIPAVAVAALVAALLVVVLPGDTDTAYAHAELWSMSGNAAGSADVNEVAAGTRVQLRADDLPVRHGRTYELWCVRTDGRWINGGTFQARSDGTASADLTAAVEPGEYHVMVVTRHSAGGARGPEVMRGKLNY